MQFPGHVLALQDQWECTRRRQLLVYDEGLVLTKFKLGSLCFIEVLRRDHVHLVLLDGVEQLLSVYGYVSIILLKRLNQIFRFQFTSTYLTLSVELSTIMLW